MTTIVHLVRHASHAEVGHVLSGRSSIALSDAGRAEAELLSRRLADTPLAAIHASPRRRTRETAEIVARRHDLAVTDAPALDEIDFGAWTGKAFADLADDPDWQRWNCHRATSRVPDGETMAEAIARIRGFVDALPAGEMALVTHCDMIRGFVADLLGIGLDRLLDFDCDPASLTTLVRQGGRYRLATLNERPR